MHCVRACAQASQHQVVNGFKAENTILKANPSCWSIKNTVTPRIVSSVTYRAFNASYRCSKGLAGVVRAASAESILSVLENDTMSIQDLKSLLKDTLWSTERGLSADSDTRAEILEIISQLEARNPTPEPNESGGIDRLSGTWKLIYTSNSELLPLLALSRLPLVEVGDVTQTISADSLQVENKVQLSAPFSRTSLGASAVFEIRSPKLLQVQFEEGRVSTPEILSDFEIPSSMEVMGQNVDLSPLQTALRPLDGPFRSTIQRVGSLLSEVPDLKVPISQGSKTSTWLLTTYLDDDLRISRGDGGSVFILERVKNEPEDSQEMVVDTNITSTAVSNKESAEDPEIKNVEIIEETSGSIDTEPSPEY